MRFKYIVAALCLGAFVSCDKESISEPGFDITGYKVTSIVEHFEQRG